MAAENSLNTRKYSKGRRVYRRARALLRFSVGGFWNVRANEPPHRHLPVLPILSAVLCIVVLSGCLNQIGEKKTKSKTSPVIALGGPPRNIIYKVVRTQTNPTASLDLIGAGAFSKPSFDDTYDYTSDLLGSFCNPTAGQEEAGCNCVMKYQVTPNCSGSSGSGTTDQPCVGSSTTKQTIQKSFVPLYYEANLVRCPMPDDFESGTMEISIQSRSRQTTNTVTFTPLPDLGINDRLFYRAVKRYACRHTPFIGNKIGDISSCLVKDGRDCSSDERSKPFLNMIDTIQSDSPETTSIRTFYTINAGRALAGFTGLSADLQEGFECPPHVSPHKAPLKIMKIEANGTQTILSDETGKVPDTQPDRVNFFMAKSQVAPFTRTVIVPNAPGVSTRLGYAAPRTSADGKCSTGRPTPAGFTWKKLFLFRSDSKKRVAYGASRFQNFHVTCSDGSPWPESGPTVRNAAFQIGKFRDSRGVNPNGAVGDRYPANWYFKNIDCGYYDDSTNNLYRTGLDIREIQPLDATNPLKFSVNAMEQLPAEGVRVLLPSRTLSDPGYHRCVNINQMGTSWKDQFSLSGWGCARTLGPSKLNDTFGLCYKSPETPPGGQAYNLKAEAKGDEVAQIDIPIPEQFLFYVGDDDGPEDNNLTNVQLIIHPEGGVKDTYRITNLSDEALFPLCVLQEQKVSP